VPFAALLARPIVIISLMLLASLAGNAVLYKLWQGEVRHSGAVVGERDQAIAAGQACSAATENLRNLAADRDRRLKLALAAAAKQAAASVARAETTLQAVPSKPADLCASSLDLSRQKLAERRRSVPQ
jgi:hypothetical protein